jgi:hypothetical protein
MPGTVTFLFTDIEGSTRLLQRIGAAYTTVLEDQLRLVWSAVESHGGRVVDTAGDGLFAAFEGARDAICGAGAARSGRCMRTNGRSRRKSGYGWASRGSRSCRQPDTWASMCIGPRACRRRVTVVRSWYRKRRGS